MSSGLARRLDEAATAHQARRDATQRLLIDLGVTPVPPEPGYLGPEPVTDAASALRLVITAETDAACRALLRHRPELEPTPIEGPDGPSERVRLWPHRHGCDAMFVAAFVRSR